MSRVSLLSALIAAVTQDDPEAGLGRLVFLLSDAGIRVEPPEWLEAARRGVSLPDLSLDAGSPLTPEERQCLLGIVRMAALRCAERATLQSLRERLEMLSAASFEGLMIHEGGSIVDANQRLSELLGYEREELLGPATMQRCVAPEDLPVAMAHMQNRYEGVYTIWGVRKDGTRFRAELQAKQGLLGERPVRVVAVRDVTLREQQELRLKESEQRFRELARAVFDAIVSSKEGTIIDAGGRTMQVLGYAEAEVVGRRIVDFVVDDQRPLVQQVLAEQRLTPYEVTVRKPDGSLVPVEITPIIGWRDGNPTRVAGLRDLTLQKQEQAERLALEQRIAQSQRTESLGVLAGGVAHDFNNLLLGIMGHAEHVLETVTDPAQRASLEAILEGGERAAALTSQMLAYSGQRELGELEPLNVSTLIADLGGLLSATLSKKARLSLDLEPDAHVAGNRAALSQVLMNLLTNASDALLERAGDVAIAVRSVEQPGERWRTALNRPAPAARYVEIDVRDNGAGMTKDVVSRVFEPFFTTKGQGRGLGLAAALGIVRGHRGALLVESQPGVGSCFSILLPAVSALKRVESKPSSASPQTGATVLVVDDEPLVLSFLEKCLRRAGYRVVSANNGVSALAESRKRTLDLVLLDMTMPDMDGGQVLRQLRAEGRTMPVVLSSGFVEATVERGLEPDTFQGFLHKPFRVGSLLETVSRALRKEDVGSSGSTA